MTGGDYREQVSINELLEKMATAKTKPAQHAAAPNSNPQFHEMGDAECRKWPSACFCFGFSRAKSREFCDYLAADSIEQLSFLIVDYQPHLFRDLS